MAHIFDPIMGGYRMVCEATGELSPGIASRDAQALVGVEWYSDVASARELYLARQRARFKVALVERGFSAEDAEDHAASLRWDLMPDGTVAGTPSGARIAEAEAPHPSIAQRARLRISVDRPTFASDGTEEATITIAGLVAPATVELGAGLTAEVSPADPVVRITSDVPRKFSIRVLDGLHWSAPVVLEAL